VLGYPGLVAPVGHGPQLGFHGLQPPGQEHRRALALGGDGLAPLVGLDRIPQSILDFLSGLAIDGLALPLAVAVAQVKPGFPAAVFAVPDRAFALSAPAHFVLARSAPARWAGY